MVSTRSGSETTPIKRRARSKSPAARNTPKKANHPKKAAATPKKATPPEQTAALPVSGASVSMPTSSTVLTVAAAIGLLVCGAVALNNMDKIRDFMQNMEKNMEDMGSWHGLPLAPLAVVTLYTVSTLLVLPLFGFHGVSGFVYGTFKGSLLVVFSQTFGASVAFLFARYIVRPWVTSILENRFGEKYRQLQLILGKSGQGFKIVLLMRLSPVIPFSLTNYLCGCTDIKIWEFALATFLGLAPGTTRFALFHALLRVTLIACVGGQVTDNITRYVHIGAVSKQVVKMMNEDDDAASMPPERVALLVMGVIATLIGMREVSNMATAAMEKAGLGAQKSE